MNEMRDDLLLIKRHFTQLDRLERRVDELVARDAGFTREIGELRVELATLKGRLPGELEQRLHLIEKSLERLGSPTADLELKRNKGKLYAAGATLLTIIGTAIGYLVTHWEK